MGHIVNDNTAARIDVVDSLPRWAVKLAHRIVALERGRIHTVLVIKPDGAGEPSWAVEATAKVENQRVVGVDMRQSGIIAD